jgi:hypothetical protein
VQYKVQAFSVHQKMRKKDKLAMQDAFIEREYQRLKMASQMRNTRENLSQNYSVQKLQNTNLSEKAGRGNQAESGMEVSSNHMRQFLDGSSVEEDFDDLPKAEDFVAQNTVEDSRN